MKSDMNRIESSLESLKSLSNEIKKETDEHRMLSLVDVLIHDTQSLEESERVFWKVLFSIIPFDQKFRIFEILSVVRFKLAELEREYENVTKKLNERHQKKWLDLQITEAKKNNDESALRLLAAKEISLIDPTIQGLREAEKLLNKLIIDNPKYLEAYLYLVDILYKYDEDRSYDAKVIMEKAKSQFSDSGEFQKKLGYVYLKMGDSAKAYPYLRDASMMIDDAKLHRIFSSLAIEKGEALLAKSIMDKSYEKNKDDVKFVSTYSYVLEVTGNSEQATSILSDLISKKKNEDLLYSSLGWRYYKKGQYSEAMHSFGEAAKININNYQALLMTALSNIESDGDIKESVDLAENCLKSFNYVGTASEEDEGEIYLALSVLYSETEAYEKMLNYSPIAVKRTFGCSEDYMKDRRNWRDKALALLKRHRLGIGCP